ncbi:hypothetical protein EDD36DRAFT_309159 [Exophiala viscosa]|uniref:Uncharacterized protein n=1 Tax=Exophiala viscosa TaxID=2486360 RepID=A0AAN6IB40_9EURO|nr:hypothetical protein EDD36DRAFT_309159 [Exophiala viscosa]
MLDAFLAKRYYHFYEEILCVRSGNPGYPKLRQFTSSTWVMQISKFQLLQWKISWYISTTDICGKGSFPNLLDFLICALKSTIHASMLMSTDAVLVATSIVLAVSTIVSVSVQLDRQYKTAGRLDASKCEPTR